MNCRDCPYIKDEFESRMCRYNISVENDDGGLIDFYHGVSYEDVEADMEEHCWCEKTGGKVWWYGQCSDAHSPTVMSNKMNKKRDNVNFIKHKNGKMGRKRERDWKHHNHAKYMAKISYAWYPQPWYPSTADGDYIPYFNTDKSRRWYSILKDLYDDLEFAYFKRQYRGQRSKWIKKQCNKKVRRYKGEISNGGNYKKIEDFWWEMY